MRTTEKALVEFALTLRRNVTDPYGDSRLLEDAHNLSVWARRIQRAAIRLCNGDVSQERYERLTDKVRERITGLAKELGCTKVEIGGDPRGHCVKLFFPDGSFNSLGGSESGYGVPI